MKITLTPKANLVLILLGLILIWASFYWAAPLVADSEQFSEVFSADRSKLTARDRQTSILEEKDNQTSIKLAGADQIPLRFNALRDAVGTLTLTTVEPEHCQGAAKSSTASFDISVNGYLLYEFEILNFGHPHSIPLAVQESDALTITPWLNEDTSCHWVKLDFQSSASYYRNASILISTIWIFFIGFLSVYGYWILGLLFYALFLLLITAEKANFGPLSLESITGYSLVAFSACLLFVTIRQLPIKKLRIVLAGISTVCLNVLIFALSISLVYFHNSDAVLSELTFFSIFQTNLEELLDFASQFLELKWIVLAIFGLAIFNLGIFLQFTSEARRLALLMPLSFLLILAASAYVHAEDLKLFHLASTAGKKYQFELERYRKVNEKRQLKNSSLKASPRGKGETFIVVIGESVNKAHMSLFGYFRETTPNLDQLARNNQLFVFKDSFSTHVHSVESLKLALTETSVRNPEAFFSMPSIIDIANSAGLQTTWISNQVSMGLWDNVISIMANSANNVVRLNKSIGTQSVSQMDDSVVLPKLEATLNAGPNENRLIVIHLMGSHWKYCDRFPESFNRFVELPTEKDFPVGDISKTRAKNINCYDNSILFTDYVVSEIIQQLESLQGISGLIYFSDHSDDVLNGKGHDAGRFTFHMANIPVVIWLSKKYREQYLDKIQNLNENISSTIPNDFIFEIALGMMGIETNGLNPENNPFESSFISRRSEFPMLHGNKRWDDPSNIVYTKIKNLKEFESGGLKDRLVVTNINNRYDLGEAIHDGFRLFAFDRPGEGQMEILELPPDQSLSQLQQHLNKDKSIEEVIRSLSNVQKRVSTASPGSSFTADSSRLIDRTKSDPSGMLALTSNEYSLLSEQEEPSVGGSQDYIIFDKSLSLAEEGLLRRFREQPYSDDPKVRYVILRYTSSLDSSQ
jgi:heptose-I-phosphate ethanolaminephosphotransferase